MDVSDVLIEDPHVPKNRHDLGKFEECVLEIVGAAETPLTSDQLVARARQGFDIPERLAGDVMWRLIDRGILRVTEDLRVVPRDALAATPSL